MGQMSWRTDDELLKRVRHSAKAAGMSLNSYVTNVLRLATSEDDAGSEAMRLRQRLRSAGLLAESTESGHRRPKKAEIDAAARRAGQGTPLSDLVVTMRS